MHSANDTQNSVVNSVRKDSRCGSVMSVDEGGETRPVTGSVASCAGLGSPSASASHALPIQSPLYQARPQRQSSPQHTASPHASHASSIQSPLHQASPQRQSSPQHTASLEKRVCNVSTSSAVPSMNHSQRSSTASTSFPIPTVPVSCDQKVTNKCYVKSGPRLAPLKGVSRTLRSSTISRSSLLPSTSDAAGCSVEAHDEDFPPVFDGTEDEAVGGVNKTDFPRHQPDTPFSRFISSHYSSHPMCSSRGSSITGMDAEALTLHTKALHIQDVCDQIQALCGQFKALLVTEEEDFLCDKLHNVSLTDCLHTISSSLNSLCYMIQCLSIEDLPQLVSQLIIKFEAHTMSISLTENMVDSVDQLFSSLSLHTFAEELQTTTNRMSELDIGNCRASQLDLENVCMMLRYIMTADELNNLTIMSYLQRLYIL